MERQHVILVLITSSYMCWSTVAGYNVPAMFVFGDSLFDAGNNRFNPNCTLQANFPPYGSAFFHHPTGRFTNGRTTVDFIAQFIGIDLQKPYREADIKVKNGKWKEYPSNGLNFASAGSGVLLETNKASGVTPMQQQLEQFETLVKQGRVQINLIKQSIFFFTSGSNDIFGYFIPLPVPKPDPKTYVQAMLREVENWIKRVYSLGARRIAIFSLGPVGCVPARSMIPGSPNGRCYGKMNVMIKMYNKGLERLALQIPVKYRGAIGVYGLVYDIVQHMRTNPKRFGLKNATTACCGSGSLGGQGQCGLKGYKVCPNPDVYLFWDFFHPTQHAYKIVAKSIWSGQFHRIRPFNLSTLASIGMNQIHI